MGPRGSVLGTPIAGRQRDLLRRGSAREDGDGQSDPGDGKSRQDGGVQPSIDDRALLQLGAWAAWDGVIAAHLGPANMDISDAEFERMLNQARESLVRGLLAAS